MIKTPHQGILEGSIEGLVGCISGGLAIPHMTIVRALRRILNISPKSFMLTAAQVPTVKLKGNIVDLFTEGSPVGGRWGERLSFIDLHPLMRKE